MRTQPTRPHLQGALSTARHTTTALHFHPGTAPRRRQRKSGDLTGDGDALVTRLGIDLPKSEPRPQSFKQRREEASEKDDPEMHPGVHAARVQSFKKKKKTREGESVDVAAAS